MATAGPHRIWTTFAWLSFSTVCLTCLSAGCGKSDKSGENTAKAKYEVADNNTDSVSSAPATEASPQASDMPAGNRGVSTDATTPNPGNAPGEPVQPPAISANQLEAITVPDGTAQELLAFTNQIGDKILTLRAEMGGAGHPAAKTREVELFRALITASEKILALDSATSNQRKAAVENKAGAMSMLSRLEPEADWAGKIRSFAALLATDKDPEVAVEGKSILFGIHLGEFAQGRTKDAKAVVNQLRPLLQDEARSNVVMGVSIQAMNTLLSLGFDEQAREVLDMVVEAYKDSDDPGLAGEAARLTERALFMDAEIEPKFNAVLAKRSGADNLFMTELTKLLEASPPGSLTLEKGARYIGMMQQTGQYELARKLCHLFQNAFANSADQDLKKQLDQLSQATLRRLDLLGKPLMVEARRLDGAALDFSLYQDKVVLVVFFAAFDPRCQQEMLNIKDIYKKYHEHGFEVVAVSIDPNREQLKQFLDQAKFPWVTATNNKFAEQCGADMLPFGILLDRGGKVTDIFVQGPALETKLKTLLGPSSAQPPSTQPPAGLVPKPQNTQSRFVPPRNLGSPATALVTRSLTAASCAAIATIMATVNDEPVAHDVQHDPAQQGSVVQENADAEVTPDETVNPYLAGAGLTSAELVNFLFDMQDKPKSIRRREGFSEAMVNAADRILQSNAKAKYQLIAAETKLTTLHEVACLGDDDADQQLTQFVSTLATDQRPTIMRQVKFYHLERRCLDSDKVDATAVPSLLDELQEYFKTQDKLTHQHLRIASATVHVINRLEDAEEREKKFSKFGELFAKSNDRQLARYGKKLAKGGKGRASDLVGKPLELEGITDLGTPLDWSSYRGSVVVVDFWATWCGPCLREMSHLQALYEELSDSGFDVVAISLDEDLEALAKFLKEKKLPWPNLVGEKARQSATKYDVRGIPTMMLIDRKGNVVAVDHKVEALRPQIKKLLSGGGE